MLFVMLLNLCPIARLQSGVEENNTVHCKKIVFWNILKMNFLNENLVCDHSNEPPEQYFVVGSSCNQTFGVKFSLRPNFVICPASKIQLQIDFVHACDHQYWNLWQQIAQTGCKLFVVQVTVTTWYAFSTSNTTLLCRKNNVSCISGL